MTKIFNKEPPKQNNTQKHLEPCLILVIHNNEQKHSKTTKHNTTQHKQGKTTKHPNTTHEQNETRANTQKQTNTHPKQKT